MRRTTSGAREAPPALDRAALERLALGYVGRFATTRAKLAAYLRRKLVQRGWQDEAPPPVDEIVARLGGLGYVDDAAFADARGAALTRRGYGVRRVAAALRGAGIGDAAGEEALAAAAAARWASALAFARKRRIGPFGDGAGDPAERRRQLGRMVRAGHDMAVARAIVAAASPEDIAPDA